MEFKGTKNKWQISGTDNTLIYASNDKGTNAFSLSIKTINQEQKANALLISKAPEMLENLQMNLDSLDLSNIDYFNKYGFNVSELTDRTRELIKQATEL